MNSLATLDLRQPLNSTSTKSLNNLLETLPGKNLLLDNQRVLAVDPGAKHCGFVVAKTTVDKIEWTYSSTTSPEAFTQLFTKDNLVNMDVVVIEDYFTRPETAPFQNSTNKDTMGVIGYLQHTCTNIGVPYRMQPPTIKKPTVAMTKVWSIPEYGVKTDRHARDARLHAICYWRDWIAAKQLMMDTLKYGNPELITNLEENND